MTTEQQQVALIRTMLYFMGKQQYAPTSAVVLAQLREATAAAGSAAATPAVWDVTANKAASAPAPVVKGWNLTSNKAV